MVIFQLEGLGINQEWFDVKKQFFPFGFHDVFQYNQNDGTGKLEYERISSSKKEELLSFFNENSIGFKELKKEIKINKFHNPSLYFYKDKDREYGKNIEDFSLLNTYEELFKIEGVNDSVELTTTYPGLLIGSGYNHPSLGGEEDYQLGFFFDHTTGLPIINGSSIKGVARSLFENDAKFEYLKELILMIDKDTVSINKINEIENLSDEDKIEENKELKKILIKRLFENGSTIFYDAYITATGNRGKIFGSDYITSHYSDDHMGQFKEPNPVKFLKILSDVTFQFQFKAKPHDVALFKMIILDFGLGAKTNVGYGQFRE